MIVIPNNDDIRFLRDIRKWRWAGPFFRTFPREEPGMHKNLLRLEILGLATATEVKIDSHSWLIDYDKIEEVIVQQANQG